jgi:hypothetical protein
VTTPSPTTPSRRARRVLAAGSIAVALVAVATLGQCGDEPAAAGGNGKVAPAAAPPPVVLGERLRLIVTGSMLGRLEPCGCADGQLGGLPRRLTYIQEVHGADLLLEGGDLVSGDTPLDLEKAQTALNVLFGLHESTRYDALGVGRNDLRLPLAEWGRILTENQATVVAADLECGDTPFKPRAFVEKEVRGTKVRVVSLTMRLPDLKGRLPDQKGDPLPLQLLAPAAGWARGLEGAADSTLRVLMVHDEPDRVRALARELKPRPDLAIGIDDWYHEPPGSAELAGGVPVVFPGIRGRFLVEVELGRTQDGSALPRYEIVPLRASETKPNAGQDEAARAMLLTHRAIVADAKLREAMARQLPTPNGQSYVGTKKCGECHKDDLATWQSSKHALAWKTLDDAEKDPKRYGWPVTKYPDCVGCHVVGYRQQSGFVNDEETPDLKDVGCEQCHGPGSAHAKAPKTAKMGRVGDGAPSTVCAQCHDFEQSPTFDYTSRWAIIKHGKKL